MDEYEEVWRRKNEEAMEEEFERELRVSIVLVVVSLSIVFTCPPQNSRTICQLHSLNFNYLNHETSVNGHSKREQTSQQGLYLSVHFMKKMASK